ncbi:MAG: hypothetical protein J2P30_00395 [Actinobacteria bacterium]|nr:hypothetical protein [Actinomycetota bacterium]
MSGTVTPGWPEGARALDPAAAAGWLPRQLAHQLDQEALVINAIAELPPDSQKRVARYVAERWGQ